MSPMEKMLSTQKAQIMITITLRKKYKIGTPMILLVLAMKSADASITLIAILSWLKPQ
jgi:hypothetical protein